ncbi:hypothetical protein AMTRI_Chr04g248940 [Amborella trichopoda]
MTSGILLLCSLSGGNRARRAKPMLTSLWIRAIRPRQQRGEEVEELLLQLVVLWDMCRGIDWLLGGELCPRQHGVGARVWNPYHSLWGCPFRLFVGEKGVQASYSWWEPLR